MNTVIVDEFSKLIAFIEYKINEFKENNNKKEVNVNNSDQEDYVDMNNLLKKGSKVKLLIRCNGLWSANGKFGCTWRAEQLKVKVSENFDECVFDDSDNEEEIEQLKKDIEAKK